MTIVPIRLFNPIGAMLTNVSKIPNKLIMAIAPNVAVTRVATIAQRPCDQS
jgi:hypothetical protein